MHETKEDKEMGKKNEAARMLANLNGPWSNAACMGYCLIAMRRANLRSSTISTRRTAPGADGAGAVF